jgi:hypothetical protein
MTMEDPKFRKFLKDWTSESYEEADPIEPDHYKYAIRPIDAIRDWDLNFALGNAVKYISRAGRKASSSYDEDLKKAIWYLEEELKGERK